MGTPITSEPDRRIAGRPWGRASPDTVAALISALRRTHARRVIDLGCGDGAIAAMLVAHGFEVTGIDRLDQAIDRARQNVPSARFICADPHDLPDGLGDFDAAIFVNALHHVDETAMETALLSARAVLRPGGVIVVIEPLAQGSFFRAMRPVEDETRIRAKAGHAIELVLSSGRLVLRDLHRWNRESRFSGLDDFVGYLMETSPRRARLARENADALARAWRANIRSVGGLALLVQPMIRWTLTAPVNRS